MPQKRIIFVFVLILLLISLFLSKKTAIFDKSKVYNFEAKKVFEQCQLERKEKWRTCYSQKFADLTKAKDYKYAALVLHSLQDIDSKTKDCHLIAHYISNAQIKKDSSKFEEFISKVNPNMCVGGFIHGALEVYQAYHPEEKLSNLATMQRICSIVSRNGGESYCYHMMGHLVMVDQLGEVAKSIQICQKLGSKFNYNCFTGVFMENETRTNLSDHNLAKPLPYNEESAHMEEAVCRQFEGEETRACWQELAHFYTHIANHQPQALFDLCSRASTTEGRDSCFLHGVSFIAGIEEEKMGQMSISSLCEPFMQNDQKRLEKCMNTIINVLLSSSQKFSDRLIILCQRSPQETQNSCLNKVSEAQKKKASENEFTDEEQWR